MKIKSLFLVSALAMLSSQAFANNTQQTQEPVQEKPVSYCNDVGEIASSIMRFRLRNVPIQFLEKMTANANTQSKQLVKDISPSLIAQAYNYQIPQSDDAKTKLVNSFGDAEKEKCFKKEKKANKKAKM